MKLYVKSVGRRMVTDTARQTSRSQQKTVLKHGGSFAMGFLLSGASVFGGCSPFALAFVSATAKTAFGFSSALGALLGAWLWGGGLKYAACTILIFAGIHILRDLPLLSKDYFIPLFTAALTACIGVIYVAADGWTRDATVLLALELILTGAFSYFFPIALAPDEGGPPFSQRKICRVLILAAVLVTFEPLRIGGAVSVGRILASAAVIYFGYWSGPMFGAAAGLAIGIGMDASAGTEIFLTGALASGGLVSGVFAKKGRIFSALSCLICMAGFFLWNGVFKAGIAGLYECLAGAVIFYFVPDMQDIFPTDKPLKATPSHGHQETYIRQNASKRLEDTAQAFGKLCSSLSDALTSSGKKSNTEDVSVVFVAAADRVCRKCANRHICWGKDDSTTLSACNDVTEKLHSRGVVTPGDFPKHFASRCGKIRDFSAAVSIEYASLLERRRTRVRMARSQELLCRQYGELGRILSDTAAEFSRELCYDPRAMEILERYLKKRGSDAQAVVYSDPSGRLHAEIRGGVDDLKTTAAVEEIAKVLGTPLVADSAPDCVTLSQKEPLRAIAGSAAAVKSGQEVSGDSAMYFRSETGVLYIILSDGMGSGPDALEESRNVAGLLESFLKAGVEPEVAMRTLNSALSLKTGADGAFATLDLMQLDMFTGRAAFYKLGAAPTYIKRASKVSRITASALPPGTGFGSVSADVTRLTLAPGDFIIMASDGLTEKGSDAWLMEKISQYDEKSPRQLASRLLSEASGDKGPGDDITVFIIRLEENL